MAMISGNISKRIDAMLGYLTRDPSWQDDLTKKPPVIMQRDLEPLRAEVEKMAEAGDETDAELASLRTKLNQVYETNARHAEIRSERTFQLPDAFSGAELSTLKAKADEVVSEAYADAVILRTTVPSKDWTIENVIEATDSTNTALRHRVTRSVRAQVALKRSDGKVYLQEVYLAQDQQPDGWGTLKGHTTWSDWMQQVNIGKEPPKK
jgi:hypothetical protein